MNKITPKDQEPKVDEQIEEKETTGEETPTETKLNIEVQHILGEEKPEEIILQPITDGTCTCETEDRCADHISRTKILDVIESTMARYKGKVVLAMEEVRDIIKAITTAVKE